MYCTIVEIPYPLLMSSFTGFAYLHTFIMGIIPRSAENQSHNERRCKSRSLKNVEKSIVAVSTGTSKIIVEAGSCTEVVDEGIAAAISTITTGTALIGKVGQ